MSLTAPYQPQMYRTFTDASEALAFVTEIYNANVAFIQEKFKHFVDGETPAYRVEACYPYIAVETQAQTKVDTRLSYGYVAEPGRYSTTLTRPDIFSRYYLDQFEQLIRNHQALLEVGVSEVPIPLHFAFQNGVHVEGGLSQDRVVLMRELFTIPDLTNVDDTIVDCEFVHIPGQDRPLAFFTAPRVDYSLQRLRHYTGTNASDFQSFVIFTNYQFYVDEFVRQGRDIIARTPNPSPSEYTQLVEPKKLPNANGGSLPQMPAYHLKRADGRGITIINIGVGPSNARNISDNVAVLRPDAWVMLGHCAGLRKRQKQGDYVLAHGYVREDHVLDEELPLWVPIVGLAEVQMALEVAVSEVTGLSGYEVKSVMRTGTVYTTDNRNWEIASTAKMNKRFNLSRAIALDMESAVIAANGYRYRVPYGTLLCVSDRPPQGELKLPGMATEFYQTQVNQHLAIGIKAMDILRNNGRDTLHSRKLRSFVETAFR